MALFENFPYTNFHDMNLDYLLKRVKELEGEVADLVALIETGPVVDVKTLVNGVSTSIKDSSGIANLPAASDTTFGTVKVDVASDYLDVTEDTGTYQVPKMTGGTVSPNVLPLAAAAQAGAVVVNPNPGVNGVTRIVGQASNDVAKVENGEIDASLIPNSGVTAGSYGAYWTSTDDYVKVPYFQVGADGRITSASENAYVPVIREYQTTIPAGSTMASINFPALPNSGNALTFSIQGFYLDTGMGTIGQALYAGTDFTWTWRLDSAPNTLYIYIPTALSSTAYFRILANFAPMSM